MCINRWMPFNGSRKNQSLEGISQGDHLKNTMRFSTGMEWKSCHKMLLWQTSDKWCATRIEMINRNPFRNVTKPTLLPNEVEILWEIPRTKLKLEDKQQPSGGRKAPEWYFRWSDNCLNSKHPCRIQALRCGLGFSRSIFFAFLPPPSRTFQVSYRVAIMSQ